MRMNWSWVFRMAIRNSRTRVWRLFTFSLSIVLGVAAFVAIDSFNNNIRQGLEDESAELLGADLSFYRNKGISDSLINEIESLDGDHSKEFQFNSMVGFANGGTRLALIRALEGKYPYYGNLETTPSSAADAFRNDKGALLASTLMIQFGVEIGDSISIGGQRFKVVGEVSKAPGQTGLSFTVAPPVYISAQYIKDTELLSKGSQVYYVEHVKFANTELIENEVKRLEKAADKEYVRIETIEKRKERFGSALGNFNKFLSLVGFISILLGSLGIASSVYAFAKESREIVSVLRCLGATGKEATGIYFLQIIMVGIVGSVVGVLVSILIQLFLPDLLSSLLPTELSLEIYPSSIVKGLLLGIVVTIVFSLYPLFKISGVSPIAVLRSVNFEDIEVRRSYQFLIGTLVIVYIVLFAAVILGDLAGALMFTFYLLIVLGLLFGFSLFVMNVARKVSSKLKNYEWRQGVSNLYRPNNQTTTMVFTLGMGTALVGMLLFVQDFLLSELRFSGENDKPNMILFDVRRDQHSELLSFLEEQDIELKEQVAVVSMRLSEINGRTREDIKADSLSEVPGHVLDREYRVTFRDELKESEAIIDGVFVGDREPGQPIYISLEERNAEMMGVKVGDKLVFNISGIPTEVEVGSIRKVKWNSFTTNFTVVFPNGVLEKAPQFMSYSLKTKDVEQSGMFQRELVKQFPNISVIDLDLIVDTVTDILDQIVIAIRFMTVLSVITGLIVLVSSVITTKYQRIRENVLLRTIGATTKQLIKITGVEFFALGNISVVSGLILAIGLAWMSSYYFLEVTYSLNLLIAGIIYALIVLSVFILGLFLNRKVVRKSPMEVLREEG